VSRLILLFLLGYVIWKIVQVAIRVMTTVRPSDTGRVRDEGGHQPKQKQEYTNVTDAKFEDIPKSREEDNSQRKS
jgi:hypothetical protein